MMEVVAEWESAGGFAYRRGLKEGWLPRLYRPSLVIVASKSRWIATGICSRLLGCILLNIVTNSACC
jgi:hypothetical protein